jgi:hypothetical protein
MLSHVILAVISIIFIPICMIGCRRLAYAVITDDDSVDGDSVAESRGNTNRKNIIKMLEVKVSTMKLAILSLNFPH